MNLVPIRQILSYIDTDYNKMSDLLLEKHNGAAFRISLSGDWWTLGGEERFGNTGERLLVHTPTGIAHGHANVAACGCAGNLVGGDSEAALAIVRQGNEAIW
jgi:hypothetical protein